MRVMQDQRRGDYRQRKSGRYVTCARLFLLWESAVAGAGFRIKRYKSAACSAVPSTTAIV